MASNDVYIPDELIEKLQKFHQNLEKVEEVLQPLTTTQINSSDLKISPLDRARLNLTSGYALNSLFWMYLNTLGINAKEHSIKTELERYKSFMQRVKEISDKSKAPILNKEAAVRFLRNAFWDIKDKEAASSGSTQAVTPSNEKRQHHSNEGRGRKKKQRT